MMILLDAYSMLRWLAHGYHTRNARLSVMGLLHRIEFVVQTCKYQMIHVISYYVSAYEYSYC